jgi:hypothetical protein
MKGDRMKTIVVPLAGLVLALGLAFAGQVILTAEVNYNAVHFLASFIVAVMPLTALLTTLSAAGALLAAFGYVLRQPARSRLVAVVYLAVGIIGTLYYIIPFWVGQLGLSMYTWPLWANDALGPNSAFTYTAGAAAMAGLLMLVLPRPSSPNV